MENELVIRCGNNSDSLEKLEVMCKAEAEKLLPSIVIKDVIVKVPCWTDGLGASELIGVICFKKDANGNVVYEFDNSESTL